MILDFAPRPSHRTQSFIYLAGPVIAAEGKGNSSAFARVHFENSLRDVLMCSELSSFHELINYVRQIAAQHLAKSNVRFTGAQRMLELAMPCAILRI
jgi:hypothetical protein